MGSTLRHRFDMPEALLRAEKLFSRKQKLGYVAFQAALRWDYQCEVMAVLKSEKDEVHFAMIVYLLSAIRSEGPLAADCRTCLPRHDACRKRVSNAYSISSTFVPLQTDESRHISCCTRLVIIFVQLKIDSFGIFTDAVIRQSVYNTAIIASCFSRFSDGYFPDPSVVTRESMGASLRSGLS